MACRKRKYSTGQNVRLKIIGVLNLRLLHDVPVQGVHNSELPFGTLHYDNSMI